MIYEETSVRECCRFDIEEHDFDFTYPIEILIVGGGILIRWYICRKCHRIVPYVTTQQTVRNRDINANETPPGTPLEDLSSTALQEMRERIAQKETEEAQIQQMQRALRVLKRAVARKCKQPFGPAMEAGEGIDEPEPC